MKELNLGYHEDCENLSTEDKMLLSKPKYNYTCSVCRSS